MTVLESVDVAVGHEVVFVDPYGIPHKALVTAIHGATSLEERSAYNARTIASYVERGAEAPWSLKTLDGLPFVVPSINLVYVVGDDKKTDSYGRQIDRATSVPNRVSQSAHGYYYLTASQAE